MHYIQARKANEVDERPIRVSVTVNPDGLVHLHADDVDLTLWTHNPAALALPRGVMDRAHWIPQYSVLSVNGRMFSLTSTDGRTPCKYLDHAEADEDS